MFSVIIGYLDQITIVFAFIIMILSILNFIRDRKQLDKISIIFYVDDKQEIVIDDNLTRKDCRRSEIQGILRTKLKKNKTFYEVSFLAKKEYFENIYKIQKAKEDRLLIYITADELKQFNIREDKRWLLVF